MTWTITSPRSTSTHSASRSPSTPSGIAPRFLANLTTSSAIDLTWRVEVPEAITRWSATLVLPRTSISTTSLALISSTALRTAASSASTGGGGSGRRGLMTWAWLLKGRLGRRCGKDEAIIRAQSCGPYSRARLACGRRIGTGTCPVQPFGLDLRGHGGGQPAAPGRGAAGDRLAHGGGRLRAQRLAQMVGKPGRHRGQLHRRLLPAAG